MSEYNDWVEKLKSPLPNQAVKQHEERSTRKYIPIQWYQYQLAEVTRGQWSLEIIKQNINTEAGFVEMVVRIRVGEYYRDGSGFRMFDTKDKIPNALDLAYAEAFRNTVDSYFMGWSNLGIYEKFGIHQMNGVQPVSICKKCELPVSPEELELIKQYANLRFTFHDKCIPPHLKK